MEQVFSANQFTATKWETAEQKAKFANHFVRFATNGCRATMFPQWFYTRLSMTFGHIAHYDRSGFYSTWFSDRAGASEFFDRVAGWVAYGDPEYTYSDVERALQQWVLNNPHRLIYGA